MLLYHLCLTIAAATGSAVKFRPSTLSSRRAQLDDNAICICSFHETATDDTSKRLLNFRSVLQHKHVKMFGFTAVQFCHRRKFCNGNDGCLPIRLNGGGGGSMTGWMTFTLRHVLRRVSRAIPKARLHVLTHLRTRRD
jgi:hypothetical protein